jgi:hypothetical protein
VSNTPTTSPTQPPPSVTTAPSLTSTPVDVNAVPGGSSKFSVPALLFVIVGAFLALMLWARQNDQRR